MKEKVLEKHDSIKKARRRTLKETGLNYTRFSKKKRGRRLEGSLSRVRTLRLRKGYNCTEKLTQKELCLQWKKRSPVTSLGRKICLGEEKTQALRRRKERDP